MVETKIRKVVLVDDSEDEIFMAKIFFKRQKIDAELEAFTHLDGLFSAIKQPDFNMMDTLIVIDLNLTVCKGTEGIEKIRSLSQGKDALVGISTGSEDPADKISAIEAGADFFVGKPLDRNTLLNITDGVEPLIANGGANTDLPLALTRIS